MGEKPLSCFFLFCRDHRNSLKSPGRSNSDVTSILGYKWRTLDKKTKNFYRLKAKQMRRVSITVSCFLSILNTKQEYRKHHPFPEKRKPKAEDKFITCFKISKPTISELIVFPFHPVPIAASYPEFVNEEFYVYLDNWFREAGVLPHACSSVRSEFTQ